MRLFSDPFVIFNDSNGGATGVGKIFACRDYRHLIVALATSGSATLTVKPVGSIGKSIAAITTVPDINAAPDFSAAQSQTNMYEFINFVNYADNTIVAGATGLAAAGTDIVKLIEINTNGLQYFSLRITAWTQGTLHAVVVGYSEN